MQYKRRTDLEEKKNHIVIIDIKLQTKYRIFNLYRSFSTNDTRTPLEIFQKQLNLIETCLNDKTVTPIILGDFNTDFNRNNAQSLKLAKLLKDLQLISADLMTEQDVDYTYFFTRKSKDKALKY